MSCAACQARVEKAVSAVPGVTGCAVSLLTNTMGVEGTADPEAVIKAVTDAGYGAKRESYDDPDDGNAGAMPGEKSLVNTETPVMARRLVASVLLLLPLMYLSMGHHMWGWPVPPVLKDNPVGCGICQMALAGLVMVINQKFFVNGFRGLRHLAPNMDTLVAMGSAAAFVYSLAALILMSGDRNRMTHDLYFESAAMILTLITVGKLLESVSKGRTTDALRSLMKLAPKTAVVIRDGKEEEIPVEKVRKGDRFAVKPGSHIPVDGIVIEGGGAVDEAALTGESIPVAKKEGDEVSAATVNTDGYMVCEATRVGRDTTLSKIIQMVSDASATKAPIARIADRVSGVFVPVVILIAIVTFVVWLAAGESVSFALARGISVLVISCPCALGLATPVAIMVGNGVGAKNGILFKTATSLEETGRAQMIALDKTGTITKGEPKVVGVYAADGVSEEELWRASFAIEKRSEHPLAGAVTREAERLGIGADEVTDFRSVPGMGLSGYLGGKRLFGGNLEYVRDNAKIGPEAEKLAKELSEKGETPLYFAEEDRFLGIISVADVMREDSAEALKELEALGLHTVMLTGDNKRTASAIASKAGVHETVAGVKPDGKEAVIRKLRQHGKVIMVGDGINDAPALAGAEIGMAIGRGTDVAVDAADVVLMKSTLSDAAAAVRLSRATVRNIKENLFWAFCYNAVGIPLAAGAFIPAFGWKMEPMFGAAAMSLSSFCVVSNALRLNLFDPHGKKRDKKIKDALGREPILSEAANGDICGCGDGADKASCGITFAEKDKEEEKMVKSYTVKGMMCGHCEAHVKEALLKVEGVVSAEADHDKELVTVELSAEVPEDKIRAAVEGAGYEFGA